MRQKITASSGFTQEEEKMKSRSLLIVALACVWASAMGQQTPPIQPKTVDTPKLTPLVLPGLPTGAEVVANAPLTAAEAARIAIVHQPSVAISKAAADALHGQTIQSQSLLNPTVTINGTATHVQSLIPEPNAGASVGPAVLK